MKKVSKRVFRIRILVRIRMRIRILGTIPLTNGSGSSSGSGSCSFTQKPSRRQQKIFFSYLSLYAYSFLKVHLHHSSEIKKVIKKPQNRRNQGFSSLFCLLMEGSGSESVQINYGSGYGLGRSKNIRMRYRLGKTVKKNVKKDGTMP
jgi:hypothetical protein